MPRRSRGGKRTGTPGTAYKNRTDLNTNRVEFQGQPYGIRAQQVESQRQVPVQPPPTASVPGAAGTATPPPQGPAPGTLGGLLDPTARPDEPLTAGLPIGPGPGPNPATPTGDPDMDVLRAIYKAYPSTALLRLIAAIEDE